MKYQVTIERTQRICVEIEADNDSKAEEIAGEIHEDYVINPENFDGGDESYDYTLVDENDRTVIDWS